MSDLMSDFPVILNPGNTRMFQLFLRARLHNFILGTLGDDGFRARSPERDAETAQLRVGSILTAIESALPRLLRSAFILQSLGRVSKK